MLADRGPRDRAWGAPGIVALVVWIGVGCGLQGTVLGPVDDARADAEGPREGDGGEGDGLAVADARPADGSVDGGRSEVLDAGTSALVVPLAAGQSHTCWLVDGGAMCVGQGQRSDQGPSAPAVDVVPDGVVAPTALCAGAAHACALVGDDVWCWGDDAHGQLGAAVAGQPVLRPAGRAFRRLSCGYRHTCAIAEDGSLWCWGDNEEGQLGQDDLPGAMAVGATPLRVGLESSWMAVAAGDGHTCAIRAPGSLWCWGRNTEGELGVEATEPIQIRRPVQVPFEDWTSVEVGQGSTCAVRQPGTLWCWGSSSIGAFGADAPATVYGPRSIGSSSNWSQVSLDTFHACALDRSGALWCVGRNVEGQLGVGDEESRSAWTQVEPSMRWSLVSVGRFHTCARRIDGWIGCTGRNDVGQLGTGNEARRSSFAPVLP